MPRPTHPGPSPAQTLLPRSLAGSVAVHTVLIGAGVLLGVLASGGSEREPRAFTATFAASAPAEPEPREELEPLAEAPLAEPVLAESLVWAEPDFPLATADEPEVPPTQRAADWVAERPLAIGSLVPVALPAEESGAEPGMAAAVSVAAEPAPPVVREPLARHAPAPAYPRLSRRTGEEGSVLCRLHLDATGAVLEVEVVESSGHARLDEAARTALAGWSFEPRREDGLAVPGSLLHRVTFRLSES